MERFAQSQRQQRSFEGSESARGSSWDVDFSDVFGGPPRRYSMQEVKMRYSFSETKLQELEDVDDNTTTGCGLNEKPVFGEESVNRRRYVNHGFFDDIFKADETLGSPARRPERDHFESAPGSRVLSPARPLPPPKAEPFGTSLPAQFSLPAKLTTAMDYPATSPEKSKEGTSNGISNSQIAKASFAKFLNRAINGKSEAKGDRQSPLSRQVSLSSEESPCLVLPDEKSKGSPLKEGTGNDGSQFHFSIYKWAGGGVPLMMPLRVGKSPTSEGKSRIERSSSSSTRIECDILDNERGGKPASANNQSVPSNGERKSLKVGMEKDNKQHNEKGTESRGTKNEVDVEVLEYDVFNGVDKPAVFSKNTLNDRNVVRTSDQEVKHEDIKKEVRTKESRAARSGMMPLSALLSEKLDAQGKKEENESVINSSRAAKSVPISNKKKNDARTKTSNEVPAQKDGLPGSPSTSGNTPAKTGVKGKVREFVKIFNHEAIGKTKINPDTHSQSSRWKNTDKHGLDSEGSSTQDTNEKMQSPREDIKSNDIPKVDENLYKDKVKQPSSMKTSNHGSSRYTEKKDASSSHESFGGTYKVSSGNTEDLFQESFVVKELSHHQNRVETRRDSEDNRASDAKIQQWAHGRKGNIRSLLSTLQYVLWPECGWKPIALVDIIEGGAVKRSYQRALLCLHPDKLQQKDASSHQKYIAEKVFDILQEAWDHFNSVGGI